MTDTVLNNYVPDYLVTPGEVLKDYLEAMNITEAELAAGTNLSKKTINGIIFDKTPITSKTAQKLEHYLGRPAHFWMNLEKQYQEDCLRLDGK